MHYGMLKTCDVANGPGVRVSLFVSGCTNHCKGCFQPETWDFQYGTLYTEEVQEQILKAMEPSYIQGLTILGGEPFEPENQRELVSLLKQVRQEMPQKDVWCFTGFVLEADLLPGKRKYCEVTNELLGLLDVLVDGPFIEEKKNLSLAFRGSENQRLIDLKKSRENGEIVLVKR